MAALGKQRQVDLREPSLQSKFQDNQVYAEKPCLKNNLKNNLENKQTHWRYTFVINTKRHKHSVLSEALMGSKGEAEGCVVLEINFQALDFVCPMD